MVKNIIKRIIVGVGIALAIMIIKGNFLMVVNAKEISSVNFGGVIQDYDAALNTYTWDMNDGSWVNWGSGLLYGSLSTYKLTGSSTSNFSLVRTINAYSGSGAYQCYFGSTTENNATHEKQVVSFYCPMIMGSQGLTHIIIAFQNSGQADFTARLQINGLLTFVKDDSVNINTSGIENAIDETNDKIDETNDIISDDTIDDDSVDDSLDDLNDSLPSNGTITSLLLLPVTLYQKILSQLNNNSCSAFVLGSFFGHLLRFPCINLESILGSFLYNTIDLICCGFLVLAIRKKLVDIFNHMTSLNDRGNEVE